MNGSSSACVRRLVNLFGAKLWSFCPPRTRRSNLDLLTALNSEFDNLRLLPREILGFPGAINAGFEAASGDRVGLLLSDDWLDQRAVELCLPNDADIVSSGNRVFDGDGRTVFEEVSRAPRVLDFRELSKWYGRPLHIVFDAMRTSRTSS
jgi:glycosyltransferase involved in cell wall biosynthesis